MTINPEQVNPRPVHPEPMSRESMNPEPMNQERVPPGTVMIAVSGVKNSGKTTLITRLIPILHGRGLKVATIKHDGHDFEPDVPGTDSDRHRRAGACGTAVFSANRWMVVHEGPPDDVEAIARCFPEADLILLEGFKYSPYPKIEVIRRGNSEESVCDPGSLLAVATDLGEEELQSTLPESVQILDLNDIERIAGIIYDAWQKMRKAGSSSEAERAEML